MNDLWGALENISKHFLDNVIESRYEKCWKQNWYLQLVETGEHSAIDHKWKSELLPFTFGISYLINPKHAEFANICLGCFR